MNNESEKMVWLAKRVVELERVLKAILEVGDYTFRGREGEDYLTPEFANALEDVLAVLEQPEREKARQANLEMWAKAEEAMRRTR